MGFVKLKIVKLQAEAKVDKNNIACLKDELVELNDGNHSILKLINSTLEQTWKDQNQNFLEDPENLLKKKDGIAINLW